MKQYSSTTLLIQNGTLVTPEGTFEADLLAQGERIEAIGHGLPVAHDTRVIDAEGCYVLPGIIDAHTHIALDIRPQAATGSEGVWQGHPARGACCLHGGR